MTKSVSILLLSFYLLTVVQVSELLKIPTMVEHYGEHQQGKPNISFWEFISLHYMQGEVYDDDYSKDMKLPFKSNCSVSMSSEVFVPSTLHFNFNPVISIQEYKPQKFGYSFSFYPNYFSSIWQPPKIS